MCSSHEMNRVTLSVNPKSTDEEIRQFPGQLMLSSPLSLPCLQPAREGQGPKHCHNLLDDL